MPFARVIFNKKGQFRWYHSDCDLISDLSERDLKKEWFVTDLFVPDYPDYDGRIHKQEIRSILSEPEKLVKFEIPDQIKQEVIELKKRLKEG